MLKSFSFFLYAFTFLLSLILITMFIAAINARKPNKIDNEIMAAGRRSSRLVLDTDLIISNFDGTCIIG